MLRKLRLQLRRLRLRDMYSDYDETCTPNEQRRYRLRRRIYSSPSLRRRHSCPSVSDSNDSDPEDLYWIQSARTRARTFTTNDPRSNFITFDMDRGRPWGYWRSFLASEYFDVFQRRKKGKRPHYEEERPRPTSRQPRDPYTYTRPIDPRYRKEYRWEDPRTNSPRRATSPPLGRPCPRPHGVSLPGVARFRSPEPLGRPRSDELPRQDIRRSHESVYTRPRFRPARPSSPVNERVPPRRGRRTSPFPPEPSSRPEVIIIQRKPRPTSPHSQSYPSSQPVNSRPQYAEFLSHNSIRERINRRKRNHSPEATRQPRSRNVRFAEDHEEIGGPVHFSSDSDSDSDSSTDSDSDSSGRASTQPRPRSRSPPRVVVVQPQRESSATIVERSPRDSGTGGVMRGSSHRGQERVGREGVMYEYREPRDQRRVRDFRRYV